MVLHGQKDRRTDGRTVSRISRPTHSKTSFPTPGRLISLSLSLSLSLYPPSLPLIRPVQNYGEEVARMPERAKAIWPRFDHLFSWPTNRSQNEWECFRLKSDRRQAQILSKTYTWVGHGRATCLRHRLRGSVLISIRPRMRPILDARWRGTVNAQTDRCDGDQ